MKFFKNIIFLCFLLFSINVYSNPINCKVIKVADGDTITCLTNQYQQIKVRLFQIDAPEAGQAYGQRSKQTLSQMIFGKQVNIKTFGTDRYKRMIGTIYYGNTDINLQMIKQGMAWVYPQYAKDQAYFAAHETAKMNKIGLWAQAAVPPWEWRKNKKSPGTFSTNSTKASTNQPFTCGTKHYCREMTSCKEATFYLKQCGVSSLDGNNDGIPCNKLCN